MENLIGEEVKYLIVQKNKQTKTEQLISYQAYNGSFNGVSSIMEATPFEDKEQALQLAIIQTQAGVILKHDFEYYVIEQTTVRKIATLDEESIEEDPTEEPEAEEPEE